MAWKEMVCYDGQNELLEYIVLTLLLVSAASPSSSRFFPSLFLISCRTSTKIRHLQRCHLCFSKPIPAYLRLRWLFAIQT